MGVDELAFVIFKLLIPKRGGTEASHGRFVGCVHRRCKIDVTPVMVHTNVGGRVYCGGTFTDT